MSKSFYRNEIDGFRAFAVLAVILNHISKEVLPGGYLGVDVFFVISGYVITASLYLNGKQSFGDFILNFYTRRIKRLVPALAVFVVITTIAICMFDPSPQAQLKTGLASLFGLSNIYLIKQATDYFGGSAQLNVFTHTWSLGVEEQFYLLFPLLVWIFHFNKDSENTHRRLYCTLAIITLLSLVSFVWLNQTKPVISYYSMPTRFWELAAGSLTFMYIREKGARTSTKGMSIISILAFFGILFSFFLPDNYHTVSTILVTLSTVILISCVQRNTLVFKVFTLKPILYIGLISYSLYLWHWAVLAISRWTVGIHWWSIPFQITLMFCLAAVSYSYIESPFRSVKWKISRMFTMLCGLATVAFACSIILVLLKPLNGSLYVGKKMPDMAAMGVGSLIDPYSIKEMNSVWQGQNCILSNNDQVGKSILIENCTLGDFNQAKTRVLVIGNSFSAAFVQGFDDLVREDSYAITLTSSWGASPVREIKNTGIWNKANDYYWEKVIPTLVRDLHPGDWVFMINDMAGFSPVLVTEESAASLQQLQMGLENFSDELARQKINLAVLHGNPFAREANCEPISAIKQWFQPFATPCKFFSKEETLRRRHNLDKMLSALEVKGKIKVVDLMDVFCSGSICGYEASNGQILYRDVHSHPSVEGARLSSMVIRKVLNPTMAQASN